jgi:hypothetical protein
VLAGLPDHQWSVLRDAQDKRHIVVGPPGVFAIDSKDWPGAITVKANVLRQNGLRKDDVADSAEHAALAMASLGIRPELIQAVVCFDRDDALTAWLRGTRICSTSNLDTVLRSSAYTLTPDEVGAVARHLEARLHGAEAPPLPERVRPREEQPKAANALDRQPWWRRRAGPTQSGSENRGSRSK